MKILFCGDVVGRSGREAVLKYVPALRKEHGLDCVVVSGDNAAGGFGINADNCKEFFKAGVDVITGGDHIWDQKDIPSYISNEKRLLRPHNFPSSVPGSGVFVLETVSGKKILILHLLGQVFINENLDCPFACADKVLSSYNLASNIDAVLVDFHGEATSEKCAMGLHLDGRVSGVVGSHTHIPTADARVLPKGTAYQTDTGMCGDYNSVIGMEASGPLTRFLTKMKKIKMEPANGEATLCAALIETDDKTGLAKKITPLQLGGVLHPL